MLLFLSFLLSSGEAKDFPPGPKTGRIIAVYDGDTFTLDTGDKIRLRGANTPELKPKEAFGIEARDAVADLLINQEVELKYGSVQRDGYGRLIAAVEVNGTDTATFLLENGLAHAFFIPPEELDTEALLAAQEKAQKAKKGLWSIQRYQSNLHMTSFHANAKGDDRENVNGEYIRVTNIAQEPINLDTYYITDIKGRKYPFADLLIPAGHTVKIISGQGTNQIDPSRQLELYLGSRTPIWNNEHDRATIYSNDGTVQDSREHKPKSKPRR